MSILLHTTYLAEFLTSLLLLFNITKIKDIFAVVELVKKLLKSRYLPTSERGPWGPVEASIEQFDSVQPASNSTNGPEARIGLLQLELLSAS